MTIKIQKNVTIYDRSDFYTRRDDNYGITKSKQCKRTANRKERTLVSGLE